MRQIVQYVGESIEINDDVVLTVVSINKGTVRLGVTTPAGFSVELEDATPHDSTAEQFSR